MNLDNFGMKNNQYLCFHLHNNAKKWRNLPNFTVFLSEILIFSLILAPREQKLGISAYYLRKKPKDPQPTY